MQFFSPPHRGRYLSGTLGSLSKKFLLQLPLLRSPNAAMFVMCARGVCAVPGAALIMMPFNSMFHEPCRCISGTTRTYQMKSRSKPGWPPPVQPLQLGTRSRWRIAAWEGRNATESFFQNWAERARRNVVADGLEEVRIHDGRASFPGGTFQLYRGGQLRHLPRHILR